MHGPAQDLHDTGSSAQVAEAVARERIQAVDLLRGLVIVLMVLDHVRDYFHVEAFMFDAVDPARSYPALFATRWVTHLCAPVFVALAGVSAYLQLQVGKPVSYVRRHLWIRGLWLIFLELTVVSFGFSFGIPVPFLQVIWAIGWSMIALAVVVGLPVRPVLAIGLAIVLGHNLLNPIAPDSLGASAPAWQFLHEGGLITIDGQPAGLFAYPVLPWIGVLFVGFGVGRAFLLGTAKRQRLFLQAGAAMLVAFLILRAINGYGDPDPWRARGENARTVMAFMDVEKYPPSLMYLLATLGVALLLTPVLERLPNWGRKFLLTYGQVPLFAYLVHLYIVHGLMMLTAAVTRGDPTIAFNYIVTVFTNPKAFEGWGFGLPAIYAFWVLSLALLYPLCRWYGELKRRRRSWWMYYL